MTTVAARTAAKPRPYINPATQPELSRTPLPKVSDDDWAQLNQYVSTEDMKIEVEACYVEREERLARDVQREIARRIHDEQIAAYDRYNAALFALQSAAIEYLGSLKPRLRAVELIRMVRGLRRLARQLMKHAKYNERLDNTARKRKEKRRTTIPQRTLLPRGPALRGFF